MNDIAFDLLTGYTFAILLWWVAQGFAMIFRSFRLVADA